MTISSNDCKKAIVGFLSNNPGHVAAQFCDVQEKYRTAFEADALKVSNWKRIAKERHGSSTVREFDCKPYDDQLRASTWDDGTKVTRVEVEGE